MDVGGNRLDRRKARARAALVAAARGLLASRDPAEVSIQEITDAADVGFGSFYNHFASKQELFDAAVGEVLEEHGAMLDGISAGIEDPAEVFATAVNLLRMFGLPAEEAPGSPSDACPRLFSAASGWAAPPRVARRVPGLRRAGDVPAGRIGAGQG